MRTPAMVPAGPAAAVHADTDDAANVGGDDAVNADADVTAHVNGAVDFDRLYDAHIDFVWRSARQLRVAPDAIDDVCQEVFITVFRQLASFRAEATIKTWIFAIVRNVVSNHHRTRRRRPADSPQQSQDAVDALVQIPDRPDANPEHQLARHQEAALAQRVLDALPDELRLVLWLSDVEELSAPEVAAALGWNVNTTYTRLRNARRDFSRTLRAARARILIGGSNGPR
ncbi:MAG: RNA polymerase sigma factor [Myxococcota bacterium]